MLYWFISLNMPKVNCAVVGCSSSTYGINKWKKEPCLEHGDKNVVKAQCPNSQRKDLIVFSVFQLRWQKAKRETHGFRFSNEKIQTDQNWPQKAVICSLLPGDGIAAIANPLPTMHTGDDTKRQTQRPCFKHPLRAKKTRVKKGEMEIGIINNK